MAISHDLDRLDATATAEFIRNGEVSPIEVVDAAIGRIEATNPILNAVIHERFEKARAEASAPLPDGPFRGVPFLLKDLETRSIGDPHHAGSAFLKNASYISDRDDHVTSRFRAAGLVIVGRTNTPEFGTTITTEPESHGPSRNPWNTDFSTGGSSGGSAAAVAALMVPAAHASDGGGSIRIPASECGLVGLKATRGRVPLGPEVSDSWAGSTTNGIVTRSVRDTAALLDAIAGPMPGDSYAAPVLPGPLLREVGKDPGALRIGLLDHPLLPGVDSSNEMTDAIRFTATLLEQLGHKIEDSHPEAMSDAKFTDAFTTVIAAHVAHELVTWGRVLGREITQLDVEERNWMFAAIGGSFTAPQYLDAIYWQQEWSRRMATWWKNPFNPNGFDILCTPVLNGPPPKIGWLSDPVEGLNRVTSMMQYTAQFNVTGQPAISLPLWWTNDGLPVGIQFVAPFGREDLLIRLASALEAACPWDYRIPELSKR
ncbi:MAG: amidase [Acidimicrobiales bacterium]